MYHHDDDNERKGIREREKERESKTETEIQERGNTLLPPDDYTVSLWLQQTPWRVQSQQF